MFAAAMILTFSAENYHTICDVLAAIDTGLASIKAAYGYPPLWKRPNNFETLVHFILEQQVSLASAFAALTKLKERVGEIIPASVLLLTESEMRECYCSRQKQAYIRGVATALQNGDLDLDAFYTMDDDDVRRQLVALKGIGNWTADVYLMFVLQRQDIFPAGDLAAINAFRALRADKPALLKQEIIEGTELWKPYRTVATMMLWHYYLSKRPAPKV